MEQTAKHATKRKRTGAKSGGITFSGAVVRITAITVLFTLSALLLVGLAVYLTPDPIALTFFAALAVLVLSALCLGFLAVRLCPSGELACAAASAVLIAALLSALCALFGSFAGYSVTLYVGYILLSLLFCIIISAVRKNMRSRPRRRR